MVGKQFAVVDAHDAADLERKCGLMAAYCRSTAPDAAFSD